VNTSQLSTDVTQCFIPGISQTRNPFFWLFSTSLNPLFFSHQIRIFLKTWNCYYLEPGIAFKYK